ncbi:hypothetical protein ASwh1_394 [Aeromonas phage Aswh_1]|nr:hypothetical protein ASwh1_394 [Aeromonas phage Aswh_1]
MSHIASLAKKLVNVAEHQITDEVYDQATNVVGVDYDWACEVIYRGDVEECIEVIRAYMDFLNCFPAQYWFPSLKDDMQEINSLLK